tara:strand:- start:458 stop:826 length:369 start_codon:yes stop_codon:yes gene_type:complete
MGLSYSSCAYAKLSTETDAVQLVPLNTRGRLYSVWFNPVASGGDLTSSNNLTIKDGNSSGTVIWESGNTKSQSYIYSYGMTPYNFPLHGILFENGLNAVRSGYSGMYSITVTYSGGPPEISG